MTNSTADRLVDHYLTRLADAAQALPPARRTELLSEIREHIDASMTDGAGTDETSVRTMLDRLGEPDDIIAAAMEIDPPEHPTSPPKLQRHQQGIGLEIGAAIMLTAGSFIPFFGWLIGVMLLWSSGIWRRSEKILATLVIPGGPGLALIGTGYVSLLAASASKSACKTQMRGTAVQVPATAVPSGGEALPSAVAGGAQIFPAADACGSSALTSVLGNALVLFGLVAPVVVAIVLLNRARRRAAPETQ